MLATLQDLDWKPVDRAIAEALLTRLVYSSSAAAPTQFDAIGVAGEVADLPVYNKFKLLRLSVLLDPDEPEQDPLYALWDGEEQLLHLGGTSTPIHEANDLEKLQLTATTAADYIRLFCLAVRGDDGPFRIVEAGPAHAVEGADELLKLAHPLKATGNDDQGRFLFDAVVAYRTDVFTSTFAVATGGLIEMVSDTHRLSDVPEAALPELPVLGDPQKLRVSLLARAVPPPPPQAAAPPAPPAPPKPPKPTLRILVELLLTQALRSRAQHRLIEYFNATRTGSEVLDQFAELVTQAFPVVVVETSLPFVEETIGEIVLERAQPPRPFNLARAASSGDDTQVSLDVPAVPSLVLLPLQVYRRVVNLDRLAFDLASRDAAAIIACDRFDQLPESLRRLTDVTLRLSAVDATVFAGLFEQVMGAPLTAGWNAAGDAWVKHLLHTDFEQPRRLGMQPDKAFDYVRSMVMERLVSVDTQSEMGLADLHGLGEARQFAQDLIADIHAAVRGEIPWTQVDRGALLVGPPGTGKTTLARAIAKDCGVRFITASATGWQASGDHLGHHIAAIRKTFAEARGYAPSILFIDEIDSLGSRENFEGRSSQYQTEVVNAVLEQIQDIDPAAPVFVIGATNNADRVDPALRRSGRLDRVIPIPRPSSDALMQIFGHYLRRAAKHTAIDPALDTKTLGGLSLGLTGADVERIVRGASRRARKERRSLSQQDVIAEITNKPRNASDSLRMSPAEIERVAWHEAGHALAMLLGTSRGASIGFVTVVPRADGSLGFVAPLPDERISLTRSDYDETLEIYLAGRAAEELRYGAEGVSGGASSDLRGATAMAAHLLTRLGLGGPRQLLWQEALHDHHRATVETILTEAYDRILGKLHSHRDRLQQLAQTLIARQELTGDEVRALLPH